MPAAVEVQNLTMTYRNGPHQNTAVDDLSISMGAGEITSILGPNGAGKTSTIEACEGFRRPTSGQIRVLGRDPQRDAAELRPRVGVMLQEGGAWLGVRAGEMIRHIASLHAHPLPVDPLIERLGLGDHQRTPFRRLSGGQRQRLSLAMAVVGRPELVFLDEPTAGLDPQARRATWDLVSELRRSGVSIVMTTHHMDEAQALSDRIHILDHGQLVASGSPAELLSSDVSTGLILDVHGEAELGDLVNSVPGVLGVVPLTPGRYRIEATATTELMAAVMTWCASTGVEVRSLSQEQLTLEERFLDLTGRTVR